MPRRPSAVSLILVALAPACIAPPTESAGGDNPLAEETSDARSALNAAQPEVPAVTRDVAMITSGQYTHPTTPAFRTSADGRVALNLKSFKGKPAFYLLAPEKLTGPFAAAAPGTPMLASTTPASFSLTDASLHQHDAALGTGGISHRTICDATAAFPAAGASINPRTCGTGGASDCYDLTIVSTYAWTDASAKEHVEIWGTPVAVQVNNPKTANATLAGITAGTPVKGPTWDVGAFFEPMVAADGHLLVGRIADSTITWPGATGNVTGTYDIVYIPGDFTKAPCDVTQWGQIHPISHAPYDAAMKARYGFAQYPLRDSEGALVPDGADLKATYPWMDRGGKNLFFTTVSSMLHHINTATGLVETRYPAACVPGQSCVSPTSTTTIGGAEETGKTRGVVVAGLWTHGKMVMLDNLINNTDYGLHVADDEQRMVSLYQPGTGPAGTETGDVRVGAGRYNDTADWPAGTTHNTTFIDSLENLFNLLPNAQPITVRDVVWTVNSGRGSDEVAFDDYLDPDALIVSEMAGSMSFSGGPLKSQYYYHDGFVRTSSTNGLGFSDTEGVRVQNAATATPDRWVIPAYGKVVGGARLEPVAVGGIRGKGLWLDGADDAIEYAVAAQPTDIDTSTFYASVFLDSRFADDSTSRRLFTFPDGTHIDSIGRHAVTYVDASGATAGTVSLPAAAPLSYKGFRHLGFLVDNGGGRVQFFLDGYRLNVWTSTTVQLFRLTPGTFRVGAASGAAGVRGWIDEVKIILRRPDQEVACNHARGTLIGLPSGYTGEWATVAARYPGGAHNAITNRLTNAGKPTFPKYACFHDYANETGARLDNIPAGTTSIRNAIVFPEGPLVVNTPRPDVSANTFCLSCHVDGQPSSLSPAALSYNGSLVMQADPRRQPLQPPRLVFGNVPAGYVPNTGLPAVAKQATSSGLRQDWWVYP